MTLRRTGREPLRRTVEWATRLSAGQPVGGRADVPVVHRETHPIPVGSRTTGDAGWESPLLAERRAEMPEVEA
jgi:hypothetical protein